MTLRRYIGRALNHHLPPHIGHRGDLCLRPGADIAVATWRSWSRNFTTFTKAFELIDEPATPPRTFLITPAAQICAEKGRWTR